MGKIDTARTPERTEGLASKKRTSESKSPVATSADPAILEAQHQACVTVADRCAELAQLSEAKNLRFLAYLLEMVRQEALDAAVKLAKR